MKGRKKKPTELKKLEGTYQSCRELDNQFSPEKTEEIPTPMNLLNERALKEWGVVTSELESKNMLYGVDLSLLAAYCNEMATYWECQEVIRNEGYFDVSPNGLKVKKQEISTGRDALDRAIKLATQFGFTPSARTKISMPKQQPKDVIDGIL